MSSPWSSISLRTSENPLEWMPEEASAGADVDAGQQPAALSRADGEAGEVVIAGGVHARHLRRFATDQGAARLPAPGGDAGDHTLCDRRIQLAGGEIVEEEQRFGPLDHKVVDAHGDKVDADCVMPARCDRQFQLGADAVGRRHQDRIPIACVTQIEQAAEPAKPAQAAGPLGGARERLDRVHQRCACRNIDTSAPVRFSVGAVVDLRLVRGAHGKGVFTGL